MAVDLQKQFAALMKLLAEIQKAMVKGEDARKQMQQMGALAGMMQTQIGQQTGSSMGGAAGQGAGGHGKVVAELRAMADRIEKDLARMRGLIKELE